MLCSQPRHFTLTVSLSSQELKLANGELFAKSVKSMGGGGGGLTGEGLASHPGTAILLRLALCYGKGMSFAVVGHWAHNNFIGLHYEDPSTQT